MRIALASIALLLVGCGVTPHKPLFHLGDSTPPPPAHAQPAPTQPIPPAQAPPSPQPVALHPDAASVASPTATQEEIQQLIARLRAGKTGERKAVLDRLEKLGDSARPDLERALEDSLFESDVLGEALARLGVKDPAPTSTPALGIERKKAVASPWVEAKYRLALEKFLAGDDLGAQQLVEAILTVEPATSARPRLERLRRQIRDHLIAETVIRSTLVPDSDVLAPSQPLHAKILLENRTNEDVTLAAAQGSPLGQVVLDYEELRPDGTRALRRTTRPVKIGPNGIKLAAHARRDLEVELPTEHSTKAKGLVGRYRISGRLRPFTLLAGEEPVPYFLPVPLVEVIVLDEGDRSLAEAPKASFTKSLREAEDARSEAGLEKATHAAFSAALIWATRDRDAAVKGIVDALERSTEKTETTLTAALARATGEPGSYSKDEWLAWWKSGTARPRAARPSGDAEDEAPR